jgi:hypothetical protein
MKKDHNQHFNSRDLKSLGEAYDKSVDALTPHAESEKSGSRARYRRQAIAKTVLGAAKGGERDADKLASTTIDKMEVQ